MKDVFLKRETNEISFNYEKDKSVCIGETDGTLTEFLAWMKEDWISKGIDTNNLPKIHPSQTQR